MDKGYTFIKRFSDLAVSITGFMLVSPIIIISATLIWLEDRTANPFIMQERIGIGDKSFHLIKLRTMRTVRFQNGRKLTDAERLLKTGKLFRKFSIDELPQLVNVLRGDMSLIGPRPMPVAYLPYFRPEERVRHKVRPGMSGLAQVKGRNFLTWDEKFAYDIQYIEKFGPWLDVQIFFRTIMRLLLPSGVGTRGEDLPTASLHEVREPWDSICKTARVE